MCNGMGSWYCAELGTGSRKSGTVGVSFVEAFIVWHLTLHEYAALIAEWGRWKERKREGEIQERVGRDYQVHTWLGKGKRGTEERGGKEARFGRPCDDEA